MTRSGRRTCRRIRLGKLRKRWPRTSNPRSRVMSGWSSGWSGLTSRSASPPCRSSSDNRPGSLTRRRPGRRLLQSDAVFCNPLHAGQCTSGRGSAFGMGRGRAGRNGAPGGRKEIPMIDRRHVPSWLRERLYRRANGRCQHCGESITLETMQVAHLRAHAHGGPLVEENLAAWCAPCNAAVGATDVADGRVTPRGWQTEALEPIVQEIINSGVATLSAAPGAGKTIFAGLIFEQLRAVDHVARMLVVVPRLTIVDQWIQSLARDRHLELKPASTCER